MPEVAKVSLDSFWRIVLLFARLLESVHGDWRIPSCAYSGHHICSGEAIKDATLKPLVLRNSITSRSKTQCPPAEPRHPCAASTTWNTAAPPHLLRHLARRTRWHLPCCGLRIATIRCHAEMLRSFTSILATTHMGPSMANVPGVWSRSASACASPCHAQYPYRGTVLLSE